MAMISRRRFVRNAALLGAGATLPLTGYTTKQTSAQTAKTLDIYVAVWPSLTNTKLPWGTSSPQHLAQEFSHMLWEYFRSYGIHRVQAALAAISKKASVIGHASLFAEQHHGNQTNHIIFSNTGGNPGFYENPGTFMPSLKMPSDKFPEKYRNLDRPGEPGFLACFFVDELLAGHVDDGKWESPSEYERRVFNNNNFRVIKYEYTDNKTVEKIWERLHDVMNQNGEKQHTGEKQHIGAPKYFGLNANAVRPVNNFGQKLSLSHYGTGSCIYTIPGGCANAVAGVLKATACALSKINETSVEIELNKLVPNSANFAINNGGGINLGSLAGIAIPIVTGKQEYNNRREPTDQKLIDALKSVPRKWSSGGDRIEFTDPNYWHQRIPDNETLKKQFKNRVQLAARTKPYPDHP